MKKRWLIEGVIDMEVETYMNPCDEDKSIIRVWGAGKPNREFLVYIYDLYDIAPFTWDAPWRYAPPTAQWITFNADGDIRAWRKMPVVQGDYQWWSQESWWLMGYAPDGTDLTRWRESLVRRPE